MILEEIFLVQIIITIIFCVIFSIFDLKKGFVPDKWNYILLGFGIISNLILTIYTTNIKFIFFSIISWFITFIVCLMLWKLNVWGGGDVKLLASIASVIPSGLNISFLNISPILSFYPFSFTVIVNSILVSFPFLIFLLVYFIIKNDAFNQNSQVIKGFFNYRSLKILIDSNFNKHINISDLKVGMMINNYYFDNEKVKELIESNPDTNLKVFKSNNDEFKYYFKTITAGGLTKKDMYLLKIMNSLEIISNQISVKFGIPYVPSILIGLIIAIFYGDLCMLILKNVIFVI